MRRKETAGAIASYSKIAEALCKEIRAGVYSNEESFPSLTKIMQRFGVSRPSAVRSVAELKRLGLVTTRKGAGTFNSQKNRTIGLAIPGTADSEFFSAIMDGLVFNCNKYGMDLVAGDIGHGQVVVGFSVRVGTHDLVPEPPRDLVLGDVEAFGGISARLRG